MKKNVAIIAVLLLAGLANAAVTNLFPNGNFDSPAGANWAEVFGGGTTTYSYPTSGGNPGGYGIMNNTSGWGIWVGGATTPLSLTSLGLVAGGTYTFVMDMKNITGTGIGKLKIESWAGGVMLSDSGEIAASSQSGSWATYSFPVTLNAGATGIKVVPVAGAASQIGFDNLGVIVTSAPLTVSITSPVNSAVVTTNFSIDATAMVTPGSVTNVSFYDGAVLVGNDTTSPYSYAVNGAALGAHTLKAIAQDSSGNSATSSVVNVIVTNVSTGWQLVWSDEFGQADGSSPDSTKWNFDVGGGGWGNNQQEYDTARTNNARVQGGNLVIEARQESYMGRSYTSARMLTKGKWAWTYGRMEARIKIPRGQGIWPAFWTLGTNIDGPGGVGWPACGEIDIMENIGKTNNNEHGKIYGTIHGPQSGVGDYNGGAGVGGSYTLPGGAVYADDFHVFAIEWTTNQIKWYMDNQQYFTATPFSLPGGGTWPFTQPQFILLNLAVGGNWPGYPSNYTVFPQQMLVDYVRVYTYVSAPPTVPNTPTGLRVSPGSSKVFLSWDDSTSGATSYNVKRATSSGGPYTTVGTPPTNNFTDTGVANCTTYYYVVSATNSVGESANSSAQTASLGAYAVAVNSGGSAAGHFAADANVTGGTVGATVSTAIDTSGLVAPAPQVVYQAERYGNMTYTFPGLISGATYKVRLHNVETYWTAIGQRRFNVTINGTQVLTNFDIIAAAGAANKAVINEFNAVANGSGQIIIQYTTVTDNARASGIEIILPQPASPAGLTAVASNAQVALKWNALSSTSYTVERAPAIGGPYSPLVSGLSTTNYNDFAVTNGVTYFYAVSATILGCEGTNSVPVSATPLCTPPPAPTAGNNGPVWAGMTVNLTASTVPGATYSWTGPNGFSATNQNPVIPNASPSNSGIFSVTTTTGACSSTPATTTVLVNPLPSLAIQSLPGNILLSWSAGALQSATNLSGPWSNVSGATSPRTNPVSAAQEFYRLQLP